MAIKREFGAHSCISIGRRCERPCQRASTSPTAASVYPDTATTRRDRSIRRQQRRTERPQLFRKGIVCVFKAIYSRAVGLAIAFLLGCLNVLLRSLCFHAICLLQRHSVCNVVVSSRHSQPFHYISDYGQVVHTHIHTCFRHQAV